ncbi:iron-sulfur cluster repair protein YtfE [Marinobacter nanhaiticus D15-8W]|uniref:Iron-sulfur cluster repair protein YtfE n=1 Tax=Marinobacter nanhaiticus D15-8W TaxID=626887 RepID=N6W1G6_9GAMM|nr:iron-sulfur cluster repair protein YtfE [Marinobacter nanhaiticus]ENO16360.1 iron-sulfur cluster repair protein YtfE [Marinobacter nanhaiticus D15-8W]BES72779.1 iron-sulfur cluster repair protein YtfE [Marinobacter nanhaiticus D15-8W]
MNLQEQTVGQLARDIPGATALFHKLKLDFCCGGNKPLAEAAAKRGLDIAELVGALEGLNPDPMDHQQTGQLDNPELIEHILTRYHDVHRQQLPELIRLAQRVERVHGGHPACPAGLGAHLEHMQQELEDHMAKEEQILFPMIARGMAGMATAPVMVMRQDHDDHGDALDTVLALTGELTLPDGACNTWRALYAGLETIRQDLMEHIHLENNVLFHRIDGRLGGMRND